ncbi:hypothetical protein Mal52_11840 [Symmachiella dynata]|uniref:Uncharacterized protein n=1 Tax=Symmachiella dynata TaxID=2527995 RepID=A0A517ZJV0_9PLAN|nr:hypothetical protein Mal52_11840 [Symmachiella dynata]
MNETLLVNGARKLRLLAGCARPDCCAIAATLSQFYAYRIQGWLLWERGGHVVRRVYFRDMYIAGASMIQGVDQVRPSLALQTSKK